MKTIIKNGRLVDPSQNLDAVLDLLIEDGKIKETAPHIDVDADEVTHDTHGPVVPLALLIRVHPFAGTWPGSQGRPGHRDHGSRCGGHYPGSLYAQYQTGD